MVSLSPTAATPLPKSSVAPASPSKDVATPQTVPFPSPQTFEIIPPLHGILHRLLSQKNPSGTSAPGDTSGAPGTSAEAQPQSQQGPDVTGGNNNHTASQAIPGGSNLDPNSQPPLNVKGLPTEASSVKIRIQKARTTVEGLPDVHRSVKEQQKEIAELEKRVARLKSVISDFGSRAGQAL
ncbi:hypothetical protein N7495_008523 [Penicillium taxi]|uniref:uncharacterized protein n=1 Tax=Penicillium taxi TaxID=168475 RepID=UPI002545B3A1|nr:uncharacterized protein N7495_008523 [Penicillium taxi]KAJ5888482.1 hypothetical protein N7495_008523 [Penicillium taxi]